MDVPDSALPSPVDALLLEYVPQRPPRPPSPPVDSSTPIGRAIAGFYLAVEAVDESDRIREAADWLEQQNTLLEWRRNLVDTTTPEPSADSARAAGEESRRKYTAIAHGITQVETVRHRARTMLREITATARRAGESLERSCTGSHTTDISTAMSAAIRREAIVVAETAVRQINHQTRLVLDLDPTTATIAVEDWQASHGLSIDP